MQETLKKAAHWYIREYNFSLEEMRQDLKIVLHRRNIALAQGKIKKYGEPLPPPKSSKPPFV